MLRIDDHGRWSIEHDDSLVLRQFFARRELAGDPGDRVQVVGVDVVHDTTGEKATPILVVQSAEFGAVAAGWEGPTASFAIPDFEAEYEPLESAEVRLIAAQQQLDSIAADEAREKAEKEARRRQWDWSYNPKTKTKAVKS